MSLFPSPLPSPLPPSPLLEVSGLTMRFGGLTAVDGVDLTARQGQITALIGPNGAGKTTFFNCLTGFYRPTAGRLRLHHPDRGAVELQRLPGHKVAGLGVVRTFQNIRLFAGMTVLENLMVAQHGPLMRASRFSLAGLLGTPGWRAAQAAALDRARHWLHRLDLLPHADSVAGTLAYGLQRRVEIARAMCTTPLLLCLDEPAAGLNPRETAALGSLLRDIRAEAGIGILLIEHDMGLVMGISDHIVVMDHGARIAAGDPDGIRGDERVIRAYLGEPEDAL